MFELFLWRKGSVHPGETGISRGGLVRMRATAFFEINKPVEFVDVHIDRDNQLFVDPSAIRWEAKQGDSWSIDAYDSIDRFFDAFLQFLWPGADTDHARAREMLLQFHEPRETRLGMSAEGFDGSGTSQKLGNQIWKSLSENPLCTIAVPILRHLEDIPLFVEDVASDRVSDITTRLIFKDLVSFTHEQMSAHPTLEARAREGEFQVWDSRANSWSKEQIRLPVAQADRPLLLVPKRWIHRHLRMSHGKYWSGEIMGSIQEERTTYGSDGKEIKPTKEYLKQREEYQAKRPLNTSQTLKAWSRDNIDLLKKFRERIDSTYKPLSDDEIEARLGE